MLMTQDRQFGIVRFITKNIFTRYFPLILYNLMDIVVKAVYHERYQSPNIFLSEKIKMSKLEPP